jgi:dihydropteroate synthase
MGAERMIGRGGEHGAGQRRVGEAGTVQPEGCAAAEPRCALWGILNATPDSFSDGGLYLEPSRARARVEQLIAQGADVIDIGGASSRPAGKTYGEGAALVSVQEELDRVGPVLEVACSFGVPVSIDTTRAAVARAALSLGARIVNDVSCAASDELLDAVAAAGAQYVVMHTRGQGEICSPHTDYGDVVAEVCAELEQGVARAMAHGVARAGIWVDPGIGFAKTAAQSLRLLAQLERLGALGLPILVGASRKAFIAEVAPAPDGSRPAPSAREPGSLAVLVAAAWKNAAAIRVHEVAPARQALLVAQALRAAAADSMERAPC